MHTVRRGTVITYGCNYSGAQSDSKSKQGTVYIRHVCVCVFVCVLACICIKAITTDVERDQSNDADGRKLLKPSSIR
jgi:hypothetical protein